MQGETAANQGVQDARAFVLDKLDDLDASSTSLNLSEQKSENHRRS